MLVRARNRCDTFSISDIYLNRVVTPFFWFDTVSSCNLTSIAKTSSTTGIIYEPDTISNVHYPRLPAQPSQVSQLLPKQTVMGPKCFRLSVKSIWRGVTNGKFPLYSFHAISKTFKYCSKGCLQGIGKRLLTGAFVLKCEVLSMHSFSCKRVLAHQNLSVRRYYQGVAGLEIWRSPVQVPL